MTGIFADNNFKSFLKVFFSNSSGTRSSSIEGWISDMRIDGPTFVPKSGYFLLIWVKVCPQKFPFS